MSDCRFRQISTVFFQSLGVFLGQHNDDNSVLGNVMLSRSKSKLQATLAKASSFKGDGDALDSLTCLRDLQVSISHVISGVTLSGPYKETISRLNTER